jgi:membrane protein insertase Oxa1/YidC/SpoIIIJ
VQQKMTTVPTTDPKQQQTNNMMLVMMPLMFAYFTISVPSGLALYWAVSNVIGIALQWIMFGKGNLSWKSLISFAPAPAASASPATTEQPSGAAAVGAVEKRAANGKSRSKRKDRR